MWTAGYKYSWRKMEAAAQNSAEDAEEWSEDYVPLAATRVRHGSILPDQIQSNPWTDRIHVQLWQG